MKRALCICLSVYCFVAHTRDISHFYIAQLFPGEPRFEKPWLAEGFSRMTASSSEFSYDFNGKQQPLFDIFGKHDPTTWARELTDLMPRQNTIDQLLENIQDTHTPPLTVDGDLQVIQAELQYTHNFEHGLFATFHLPIRHFTFSHINIDLVSDQFSQEMDTFSKRIPDILARLGFTQLARNGSRLGDASFLFGYTHNYEDTTHLDFIDTTLYLGVLTPSGDIPDTQIVFDLPSGYFGRTGVPLGYTGAIGIYDWLTFGWFTHALLLAPQNTLTRIHTVRDGSGWIAPRAVQIHLSDGHLINAGLYAKADHILQGISFLLGYSYTQQRPAHVHARDADARPNVHVNADERFRAWNMHVFHWSASYDFAHAEMPHAPELTVFCNHTLDGNRVFESTAGGISLGCNIAFTY